MTDSRAYSKDEFAAGEAVEKPRARRNWHKYLAESEGSFARAVRGVYRGVRTFSLPAPRVIVRPMAVGIEGVRGAYYQLLRIFICEPYFKAHWRGMGRICGRIVICTGLMGRGTLFAGMG